ncbi:uncharacterized protein SAPINGB_P002860 [Magnusiomyces paraingens]|uniref:RING-type domain-containing protein n=1 Tax=Magnusiomyces paraingens TaxID=2606893 RepID=A0A5E8BJH9_9ASCO|nr:uncharacterized protein SAPINGB_P002860 [Saprochaete ingens]VVT50727.1 unnamed protein product [Saprochaete ingens]
MIINIRADDTNTPLVLAIVLSISGVVVMVIVGFTIWSLKRSRKKARMEFFEVDQEFFMPLPPGYQYRLRSLEEIGDSRLMPVITPIERWFIRRRRGNDSGGSIMRGNIMVAYGGEQPICVRTYPRNHPLYNENQRGVVAIRMPPIPISDLPRLPESEFSRPDNMRSTTTLESLTTEEEVPLSPVNTVVEDLDATVNSSSSISNRNQQGPPRGRRKNTTRPVVYIGAQPEVNLFIGTKTVAGHVALLAEGNIHQDLDGLCVVCQEKVVDKPDEEIEEEEAIVTLPCLHSFHECCIARWMICYSPRCPVCSKKYIIRNGKRRQKTIGKWE